MALLPQPGVHALLVEVVQARQRAHDRAVAELVQAHAAGAQAAVLRRPALALRSASARPAHAAPSACAASEWRVICGGL